MARGRAPTHNAYRGTLGRTQTRALHVAAGAGDIVATVYTAVDAVADPELIDRMLSDDPAHALNTVEVGGEQLALAVPVVYHDPAVELFVLVLADAHRHRELDERIALLTQLREDAAPAPAYVKSFAVVYGAAGLRDYLERRASEAVAQVEVQRERDRARSELVTATSQLSTATSQLSMATSQLSTAHTELSTAHDELARIRAELAELRASAERARADTSSGVVARANTAGDSARGSAPVLFSTPSLHSRTQNSTTAQVVISSAAIAATREPLQLGALIAEHHATGDEPRTTQFSQPSADSAMGPLPAAPPPGSGAIAKAKAGVRARDSERTEYNSVATRVTPEPLSRELANRRADDTRDDHDDDDDGRGRGGHDLDVDVEVDEEATSNTIIPAGSDPLTTQTRDLPFAVADSWLEFAATGADSSVHVDDDGHARVAVIATDASARGLAGTLDLRVLLHRTPSHPVIALVIGPPAAFRAPSRRQLAVVPLDIGAELDRGFLASLAREFVVRVDVIVRGERTRSVELIAPLAENVGYVLRAADDHLRELLEAGGPEPSFARACDVVLAPDFDLLGHHHADAAEFRDDKLAHVTTAQQLRRAVAVARKFAKPEREDYLVCTRGFPLARWHELRRHVVESAVTWGLWMGPELAQVAVSEGLARSRRDLIAKLDAGFTALQKHPTAFDIDGETAADNAKALAAEARALGVGLPSESADRDRDRDRDRERNVVSGETKGNPPLKQVGTDDLIAMLNDRDRRIGAAIELCERGEARAAQAVIAIAGSLSRAEAVRVLGMSVRFGSAAQAPLIANLKSSKAFLRHGSALALAMLRADSATQAVIDLLLVEPTEIWREVARAIGQIGANALMPLASTVGRLGDRLIDSQRERVAWAMAHVGVRGGRMAMETMAAGHSVVAPIARRAIELLGQAERDQTSLRGNGNGHGSVPGRDVTVNRAFSRRFFEALDGDGHAALADMDASAPMETLDEADLIESETGDEEDEHDELDESDLIQQ